MPILLGPQCRRERVYYGSLGVTAAKKSVVSKHGGYSEKKKLDIFNLINMVN